MAIAVLLLLLLTSPALAAPIELDSGQIRFALASDGRAFVRLHAPEIGTVHGGIYDYIQPGTCLACPINPEGIGRGHYRLGGPVTLNVDAWFASNESPHNQGGTLTILSQVDHVQAGANEAPFTISGSLGTLDFGFVRSVVGPSVDFVGHGTARLFMNNSEGFLSYTGVTYDIHPPITTPEPSTWLLLGTGLTALAIRSAVQFRGRRSGL